MLKKDARVRGGMECLGAPLSHDLSLAAFTINIAESNFRHTQAYVMNEFGQKGKVPLSERLSVSPEEASALTGIGLTSIREAISSGDLKAKKHGKRTIIRPDALRV